MRNHRIALPISLFVLTAFLAACPDERVDPVDDTLECEPGFDGASGACADVNECLTANGGCDENRECLNSPGGVSCGECRTGFTRFGDFGCDDVDECRDGSDNCAADEKCSNLPGSFTCSTCPSGFLPDGRGNCDDIDECLTDNGGCDVLRDCINVAGSFSCDDCLAGFDNAGDRRCEDTNECLVGNGGCDANRACVNDEGSSSCGECGAGFTPFGQTACADVDECIAGSDTCPNDRVCTNTSGAFTCELCPAGFETNNLGGCNDRNECDVDNGGCSAQRACINELGTSRCGGCPQGFAVDGAFACRDVNECLTNNGGCVNRACLNDVGSSSCDTCDAGFEEATATQCNDINECLIAPNGGCDFATDCINLPGTSFCTACPGGLEVDGFPITGEVRCPEALLVEVLGFSIGPGPIDGTTWDGTGNVPQSTFDAIRAAISTFNPLVGFVAAVGGPLLASSVDAPDSFGTITLNGNDDGLNLTKAYSYFTNDNEFAPKIDSADFSPKQNFCTLTSAPSYSVILGQANSVRIALKDEDNLFDDDLGVVNLTEAQLVAAANAMSGGAAGSAFVDTTDGRERAPILDVNVVVRPITVDELNDANVQCFADSCQYSFDGVCDEPQFCLTGTDSFDCGR